MKLRMASQAASSAAAFVIAIASFCFAIVITSSCSALPDTLWASDRRDLWDVKPKCSLYACVGRADGRADRRARVPSVFG